MAPKLGLKPTTPQKAAGRITEPPAYSLAPDTPEPEIAPRLNLYADKVKGLDNPA